MKEFMPDQGHKHTHAHIYLYRCFIFYKINKFLAESHFISVHTYNWL